MKPEDRAMNLAAAAALRAAANELRHDGVTRPKIPVGCSERVANWLDSLADLYEETDDD